MKKTRIELGFVVTMAIAFILVAWFHAPLTVFVYAFILFVLLSLMGTFKRYHREEQDATEVTTEEPTEEPTESTSSRGCVIAGSSILIFIFMLIALHIVK